MKVVSKTLALCALLTSTSSLATIVEFKTSQGTFQVNLYDNYTPETVNNFLSYVNSGRYNNTVFHRLVPGFVLQGGGVLFDNALPFKEQEKDAPVINEPKFSNVKGTIAMAKLAGDPDSATNQWFFNLNDNSVNLDIQNGGFTVFGEVIGSGFEVIEKVANSQRCNTLPVINLEADKCQDLENNLGAENLHIVESIVVIDDDPNSASELTLKENTLIESVKENDETLVDAKESSSGGAFGLFGILLGLGVFRRKK